MHYSHLSDIAKIAIGITLRSRIESSNNGNMHVISMKNLGKDNRVRLTDVARIAREKPLPRQLAQRGDLIFCSRGRVTAALLDDDVDNMLVAAPLFIIRPIRQKAQPEYLLWWINSSVSQSYFGSRAEGTMLKMVSRRSLANLRVALPPLAQQARIAEYHQLAQREQNLLAELQARKSAQAQAFLLQAVNGLGGQ